MASVYARPRSLLDCVRVWNVLLNLNSEARTNLNIFTYSVNLEAKTFEFHKKNFNFIIKFIGEIHHYFLLTADERRRRRESSGECDAGRSWCCVWMLCVVVAIKPERYNFLMASDLSSIHYQYT